jgi:hypothetical protein
MKFFLLTFILIFMGCVQNPGGAYTEYIQANQSYTYDFSQTGDFTYNPTNISLSGSGASIYPNFLIIDTFEDSIDTDWNSWVTGAANIIPNEASGVMNFDCSGASWAGREYVPSANYTDHMVYNEINVSTWDSPANAIGIIGRYVDDENYYVAQTFSNTHFIYKLEADVWSPLGTGPGFTPTANTTYSMKFRVTGSAPVTLQYKVWEKSSAEPAGWSLSVTDAITPFLNGTLSTTCYQGDGYWDNFKVYTGTTTTNYTTSAVTLQFPKVSSPEPLETWQDVSFTISASGGDLVKFEASADNGLNYLSYSAGAWNINATGITGANDYTTFKNNFSTFPTTSDSIIIRVYLQSNDGSTTPQVTAGGLTYKILK